MNERRRALIVCGAVALGAALAAADSVEKSHKLTSVSTRKLADSLYAVIAADRQVYAELLDERLPAGATGAPAAGKLLEAHDLPVPARMLQKAARNIQMGGAEFSYTLRSLWPVNEANGPQTQVEQDGLKRVAEHPEENYYCEEELGGRSYFTAIYADRATLSSCVECHNRHPHSPRHDFKVGDVMGAVVVRVPLEF